MAACCTICKGKGYTTEPTERGTTLTDRCWFCDGSVGSDEIDGNITGHWGKHLVDAAQRRRAGQ